MKARNRFGTAAAGVGFGFDRLVKPGAPSDSAINARMCQRCNRRRLTGGGKVRTNWRNGMRISLFTCAECIA